MDKMRYPRGLIRYATENALENRWPATQVLRHVLRPRVLVYGSLLVVIATAFVISLSLRRPLKVDVVRDRATLSRQVEGGAIENVYRLQVMNATEGPRSVRIVADGLPGVAVQSPVEAIALAPAEARWVTVAVRLPYDGARAAGAGPHRIDFHVSTVDAASPIAVDERSTFMVPR
jgi:polyferredoxin